MKGLIELFCLFDLFLECEGEAKSGRDMGIGLIGRKMDNNKRNQYVYEIVVYLRRIF